MRPLPTSLLLWAIFAASAQAAVTFPDVPESFWASAPVKFAAVDHSFMHAMADGKFHGDQPFTRRQLAEAMRRLLDELEAQTHASWESPGVGGYVFADMPAKDPARAVAVDLANRYHLFEGLPGVSARSLDADKVVTRYEMALVLDRLLGLGKTKAFVDPKVVPPLTHGYSDLPTNAWDYDAVRSVADTYQVMIGFPDGTFRGPEELTRYQFAATALQTFPLVHALVEKTHEATAYPSPSPTPERVQRFQEDTPLHLALAGRFDPANSAYWTGRAISYSGPFFGLLQARSGMPTLGGDHLYDGDLAVGYAWPLMPTLALQPYVGARLAETGGVTLGAASYGGILSWRATPFSLWGGFTGASPLGATAGNPQGMFLWDFRSGVGLALNQKIDVTLELGFGSLALAPAPGSTTFGSETALRGEAGVSFGF